MAEEHFFSVQPLSAVAEAPRPFGFLVSGGAFYTFVIGPLQLMVMG